MKINEYRDDLTRREGGEEQVTVAQIGEILKKINEDFCGVLYILIWLRGWKTYAVLAGIAIVVATFVLSGCTPKEDKPNTPPVAVIGVRQ